MLLEKTIALILALVGFIFIDLYLTSKLISKNIEDKYISKLQSVETIQPSDNIQCAIIRDLYSTAIDCWRLQ